MSIAARIRLLGLFAVVALAALFLNSDSAHARLVWVSNVENKCVDNPDVYCESISHVKWHPFPFEDGKQEDKTGDWHWDIKETAHVEDDNQDNHYSEFRITGHHEKGPHDGEGRGNTIIIDFSEIKLFAHRPWTKSDSKPHEDGDNDHFDVLTVTVDTMKTSAYRDVEIHLEHRKKVGGVVEVVAVGSEPRSESPSSFPTAAAVAAGGLVGAFIAAGIGGWYARRRWFR